MPDRMVTCSSCGGSGKIKRIDSNECAHRLGAYGRDGTIHYACGCGTDPCDCGSPNCHSPRATPDPAHA